MLDWKRMLVVNISARLNEHSLPAVRLKDSLWQVTQALRKRTPPLLYFSHSGACSTRRDRAEI